jgi:hypothetical protein
MTLRRELRIQAPIPEWRRRIDFCVNDPEVQIKEELLVAIQ